MNNRIITSVVSSAKWLQGQCSQWLSGGRRNHCSQVKYRIQTVCGGFSYHKVWYVYNGTSEEK